GPLPPDAAWALFTQMYTQTSTIVQATPRAATVERIVNALARQPLAISLVAAHAASEQRTLATLADALQTDGRGGLGLPTDDVAGAVALALETSLTRLPDPMRRLFATLGAFGSPEMGRAAVLALTGEVGIANANDLLGRLAQRSLVAELTDERIAQDGERERLRMHPLVHAFAVQQFAAWPESQRDALRYALVAYYTNYVERMPD